MSVAIVFTDRGQRRYPGALCAHRCRPHPDHYCYAVVSTSLGARSPPPFQIPPSGKKDPSKPLGTEKRRFTTSFRCLANGDRMCDRHGGAGVTHPCPFAGESRDDTPGVCRIGRSGGGFEPFLRRARIGDHAVRYARIERLGVGRSIGMSRGDVRAAVVRRGIGWVAARRVQGRRRLGAGSEGAIGVSGAGFGTVRGAHDIVAILSMSYACGCSSMVEPQPSKLMVRVRFPSPAQRTIYHSSAAPATTRPRGVAQLGSASALGAEGRRFKSCHPDHISIFRRRRGQYSGRVVDALGDGPTQFRNPWPPDATVGIVTVSGRVFHRGVDCPGYRQGIENSVGGADESNRSKR